MLGILLTILGANLWQWSQFGNGLENTHFQSGKGAMSIANPPVVKWSYVTGNQNENYGPSLVNLKGDDKLEVIFTSDDGNVYALNSDGSFLWSYKTGGKLEAAPAVADIDLDGELEVVIGSSDMYIYALNGEDGSLFWSYGPTGLGGTVSSGASIADIKTGDGGLLEIVVGGGYNIYALNWDGTLFWSYPVSDYVKSSPAVADIDVDGTLEVVFGCGDRYVYALNSEDGSLFWSYGPVGFGGFCASPSIADIKTGDGGRLETVLGSISGSSLLIYVLNWDGTLFWSYPITMGIESSCGIADIAGDANLEIVGGTGKIYALNWDGSLLWSYPGQIAHRGIPIANIDMSDDDLEILLPNRNSSILECLNHDGTLLWNIDVDTDIHGISIGDIDNDGCLELAFGTQGGNKFFVIDDLANTTGCGSVGVSEDREELQVTCCRLQVVNREIRFSIPSAGHAELNLYDVCGRLVKPLLDSQVDKGSHIVSMPDERNGIHFVALTHNGERLTDKVILVK